MVYQRKILFIPLFWLTVSSYFYFKVGYSLFSKYIYGIQQDVDSFVSQNVSEKQKAFKTCFFSCLRFPVIF